MRRFPLPTPPVLLLLLGKISIGLTLRACLLPLDMR